MSDTDAKHPSTTSAPPSTDPYEFGPAANVLFTGLGAKMHFVGLVTLVVGLAALVAGIMRRDAGLLVAGLLYTLFGFWTALAGSQFRSVAWTEGHDLGHLMAALEALRKLYTLQYWICLLALGAALVLLGGSALH